MLVDIFLPQMEQFCVQLADFEIDVDVVIH